MWKYDLMHFIKINMFEGFNVLLVLGWSTEDTEVPNVSLLWLKYNYRSRNSNAEVFQKTENWCFGCLHSVSICCIRMSVSFYRCGHTWLKEMDYHITVPFIFEIKGFPGWRKWSPKNIFFFINFHLKLNRFKVNYKGFGWSAYT